MTAPDRGEDRCPAPVAAAPSVHGTEWQRALLGLGAAFLVTQPTAQATA